MARRDLDISALVGLTLVSVDNRDGESIDFVSADGRRFQMFHNQSCCESVSVDDINGDLQDLIDTPILSAEEVSNNEGPKDEWTDSFTWTFYHIRTAKGDVTIKWYGTSNGYYSERVDFVEFTKGGY